MWQQLGLSGQTQNQKPWLKICRQNERIDFKPFPHITVIKASHRLRISGHLVMLALPMNYDNLH
jgi:hypothetical protein